MSREEETLRMENEALRKQIRELNRREQECELLRHMLDDLREEYLSLAQSAPDAIVSTDSRGNVIFINNAAEELFGYSPEDILGLSSAVFMPDRFKARHDEGFKRALEAGRALKPGVLTECAALRKDGTEVPIEIAHSSWRRGPDLYFAAFMRDISERKRYEQLRDDVERMIRHDLKSPLLGIVGFAKLLREDPALPQKEREWATLIFDSGMQMNYLLSNSQAMLSMQAGNYRVQAQPVNIVKLLESLGKRFEPAMREKQVGYSCSLDAAEETPSGCIIPGEEAFLDDMLSNLIKNAVEASPEGQEVRVSVREEDGFKVIDIHNLGVIPEAIRDRFFDPYVTSGKTGGTGLGVHSARLIAQAHKGGISFTTDENEGTHILVRLPIKIADAGARGAAP